jgi:hypothetical protein
MRSILIAHRDASFAELLATELRGGGYRVIVCPGPQPPAERCIRCDKGYCPLTEGADLMIYDPRLTAIGPDKQRHNLAIDSAQAHPDVPMLVAWSARTAVDPEALREIRAQAPWVRVAAEDRGVFLRQVHDLLLAGAASAR